MAAPGVPTTWGRDPQEEPSVPTPGGQNCRDGRGLLGAAVAQGPPHTHTYRSVGQQTSSAPLPLGKSEQEPALSLPEPGRGAGGPFLCGPGAGGRLDLRFSSVL